MKQMVNAQIPDYSGEQSETKSYTGELTELVAAMADGRNFTLCALRLVHFVKCNAAWLESELLG